MRQRINTLPFISPLLSRIGFQIETTDDSIGPILLINRLLYYYNRWNVIGNSTYGIKNYIYYEKIFT